MSRSDVFRLGPLTIPLPWLVFLVFAAAGYLAAMVVYRRNRDARRRIADIGFNSLLFYFLAWKLSPLLLAPGLIVSSPLSLLYLPGGTPGIIAGSAAALIAAVIGLWRTQIPARTAAARGLSVWALALLAAGGTWLVIPAVPSSVGITSSVGIRPGEKAPSFTLSALDGGRVTVPGRSQGTVVLNFWATWCPPCRGEFPEIVHFTRSISGSAIRLYAVNLTSTEHADTAAAALAGVSRFLAGVSASDVASHVLLDEQGTAAREYAVSSVPTTVIVRDGRITVYHPGVVTASWLKSVTGGGP